MSFRFDTPLVSTGFLQMLISIRDGAEPVEDRMYFSGLATSMNKLYMKDGWQTDGTLNVMTWDFKMTSGQSDPLTGIEFTVGSKPNVRLFTKQRTVGPLAINALPSTTTMTVRFTCPPGAMITSVTWSSATPKILTGYMEPDPTAAVPSSTSSMWTGIIIEEPSPPPPTPPAQVPASNNASTMVIIGSVFVALLVIIIIALAIKYKWRRMSLEEDINEGDKKGDNEYDNEYDNEDDNEDDNEADWPIFSS